MRSPFVLRRTLLLSTLAFLIVGSALYGLFEGRRLIEGPQVSIITPTDGSATSSASVTLKGYAYNISFLTINDKPAYTDEKGYFEETLSPATGYAIFTVAAVDRFGRRASAAVHITLLNYCPYA